MFSPAIDDDIAQIAALMNRAYRGAGAAPGWASEAGYISGDRTTPDLLAADLREKPGAVLLKWREATDEALSGCVWLEPLGGQVWYLGSLTADPGRQNGGLGRRMLAAAEDWVRAQAGMRVRLTVVNVRGPLIDWYLRRGYRLTGETAPFPYGDNRFGTPLRDDLVFLYLDKDLTAAAG